MPERHFHGFIRETARNAGRPTNRHILSVQTARKRCTHSKAHQIVFLSYRHLEAFWLNHEVFLSRYVLCVDGGMNLPLLLILCGVLGPLQRISTPKAARRRRSGQQNENAGPIHQSDQVLAKPAAASKAVNLSSLSETDHSTGLLLEQLEISHADEHHHHHDPLFSNHPHPATSTAPATATRTYPSVNVSIVSTEPSSTDEFARQEDASVDSDEVNILKVFWRCSHRGPAPPASPIAEEKVFLHHSIHDESTEGREEEAEEEEGGLHCLCCPTLNLSTEEDDHLEDDEDTHGTDEDDYSTASSGDSSTEM